jgi:ribonucleoside-diphosphate reductase alpha chain
LRGIRCPSIAWEQGHAVTSCADAIASVLQKYIKSESSSSSDVPGSEVIGSREMAQSGKADVTRSGSGQCPECGGPLIYQEGCNICLNCGFTKCG